MPEWLHDSVHDNSSLGVGLLAGRLLLALVLGGTIAGIYVVTQRRTRSELISFTTTIVLLTVLIAMVTLIIGNSVARAFSLAGALAIIRFRTVVEDTRDTAFVIFAVVVGMGIGAGYVLIPLVGTPIVGAAAWALSFWGRNHPPSGGDATLAIRIGLGREPAAILRPIFDKHLEHRRLRATTTARQGAALDLTYLVRLRNEADAVALVTELNQVEGIQNVELRQI